MKTYVFKPEDPDAELLAQFPTDEQLAVPSVHQEIARLSEFGLVKWDLPAEWKGRSIVKVPVKYEVSQGCCVLPFTLGRRNDA